MSAEEVVSRMEGVIGKKLDENLKATNDIGTDLKLLSQAFESKDKAFIKFEAKTESNEKDIFSRLAILEGWHAAGSVDRETMSGARKAFVKWMVVSLCSLIVTFGGGIALLMTQISKIG